MSNGLMVGPKELRVVYGLQTARSWNLKMLHFKQQDLLSLMSNVDSIVLSWRLKLVGVSEPLSSVCVLTKNEFVLYSARNVSHSRYQKSGEDSKVFRKEKKND